jgi:hypothetical protein
VGSWLRMCTQASARETSTCTARQAAVRRSGLRLAPWLAGAGLLACGLFRGAVNQSPEIRWWLFSSFGAQRLCPEMLKRSAPLRLTPGGSVIGRLYPSGCQHRVDDARRTVSLEFMGTGYAWTPIAGRVGFSMHAGVEYRADFSLQSDAMYVWARAERLLFAPQFQVGSIENRLVDWAHDQGPVGYLANTFGAQIASSQLMSGFTVVRTEAGDAFTLGILQPPERPRQPFNAGGEDRVLVESDTAEVRVEQVDFIGPVLIEAEPQNVYFRYRLSGPPGEAFLYSRSAADALREQLQTGAPLTQPPEPPLMVFALRPGAGEEQSFRLPRGQYVFVVDHSSRLGSVNPPWNPLNTVGANPLSISYRIELEAP